jgi:hypothetical protein
VNITICTDDGEVLECLTSVKNEEQWADLPTDAEILADSAPLWTEITHTLRDQLETTIRMMRRRRK